MIDAVTVVPASRPRLALPSAMTSMPPPTKMHLPTGVRSLRPPTMARCRRRSSRFRAMSRAPAVLARRPALTGVVSRGDGARLQPLLKPGQRLVSREGDLWRWDGYVAAAEAPRAAAQRLASRNRLDRARSAKAGARRAAVERRAPVLDPAEAMPRRPQRPRDRRATRCALRVAALDDARRLSPPPSARRASPPSAAALTEAARRRLSRLAEPRRLSAQAAAGLPSTARCRRASSTSSPDARARRPRSAAASPRRARPSRRIAREAEMRSRRASAPSPRSGSTGTSARASAQTRSATLRRAAAEAEGEKQELAEEPAGSRQAAAPLAMPRRLRGRGGARAEAADALAAGETVLAEADKARAHGARANSPRRASSAARAEERVDAAGRGVTEVAERIAETLELRAGGARHARRV